MQRPSILLVVTFSCILVAIALNHAIGRLELGHAVPIRIGDFPGTVGKWHVVQTNPVPDSFKEVLPTARFIDRIYQNNAGVQVDLLLLTATDYGDLHDPSACFPSQGWDLSNEDVVNIGGESVNEMDATTDVANLHVMYYRPDYYVQRPPNERLPRTIYTFYVKHFRRDIGESVLVRMYAENNSVGRAALISFANQIQPTLKQLKYEN